MDKRQKEMLTQAAPIFGFVITMFITETFKWMPATKIAWASLVSLLIFFVMVADLRQRSKGVISIKKMDLFIALLTGMYILIFAAGFLDWYRLLPEFQRLGIILFVLLIYFIILFRAMRIYLEFLELIKRKGK
jgi:hypothetical protein